MRKILSTMAMSALLVFCLTSSAQALEIIVDNVDPEASYMGTWPVHSGDGTEYGTNIQYNLAGVGDDTFTWTPDIPESGLYYVYACWIWGNQGHQCPIYHLL